MNRASPVDLRIAMESAQAFSKAGIAFVPMPARDADDLAALREESLNRLGQLVDAAEAPGGDM